MPRIRHTGPVGSILTAKGTGEGKVPEFVAATSVNNSNGALTLNVPAGVQDGDLLLAFSKHGHGAYLAAPSGWRHIGIGGTNSYGGEAHAKVASSEGASITLPNVGAVSATNGILAAFRGRTKLGELLELPEITHSPSSDTVTTAARLASRDGLLVIYSCSADTHASYDVTTPPAGMTQRHTHYGAGRSYLYTQRVKKGDELSRTIVWTSLSRPTTTTLLI